MVPREYVKLVQTLIRLTLKIVCHFKKSTKWWIQLVIMVTILVFIKCECKKKIKNIQLSSHAWGFTTIRPCNAPTEHTTLFTSLIVNQNQ